MLRLTSKLGVNLVNKLFIDGDNFPARQVPLPLRQSRHTSARHGLGRGARVADVGPRHRTCRDTDGRLGSVGRHRRWPEAGVGDTRSVVCHRVVGVVSVIQPGHGLVQTQSALQSTRTRVHVEPSHAAVGRQLPGGA